MRYPNIIFVLADDMGYWTPGFMGNTDAITPNIDDMAENGVVIENFYCSSPVCSPARASILTGRMPSYHGVLDWISSGNMPCEDTPMQVYLQGQNSYVRYLREAGYTCGISGKWHLGNSMMPQQGFSHWFVHQTGGGSYNNAPMIKDKKPFLQPGYITHAITQDAINFINQNSDGPFYLSVNYTAPHTPWTGHPQKYTSAFSGCEFKSCPITKPHPHQIMFDEFEHSREENLQGYFGASYALDEGIGHIRKALCDIGIDKNTLIIFTSDNGFSCGHNGIWGKGNGTRPFNMYEPAVRVPFAAHWPAHLPGGLRLKNLYSALDIFPTILSISGISHSEKKLPGRDFYYVMQGFEPEQDNDIIVYEEYGDTRMLRNLQYKYIRRFPYGPNELYDLHLDPNEQHNLINNASPKLINSLERKLDTWFAANSTPNKNGTGAGVTGGGQKRMSGKDGFGPDTFAPPYPLLI